MRRPARRALPLALAALAAALLLAACGGGGGGTAATTVTIYSGYATDGEVHRIDYLDGVTYGYDITPNEDRNNTLWVGAQDGQIVGTVDDYLAVLDFDLGPVPVPATIVRAVLRLSDESVEPGVVLRAELIDLGSSSGVPFTMYDFSAPQLWDDNDLTATFPTLAWRERALSTVGGFTFDVTPLMAEAQLRGLPRLQLRIRHADPLLLGVAVLRDPFAFDPAATPRLDVTYQ